MISALQRTARLVAAVAAETAAVAALLALGRRPALAVPFHRLGPWLASQPPADVLVAVLRWVALVGAIWLLVSTLLYALATASHIPGAVRAVRWSTLPLARRVVDTAFAVSVVTGAVVAPVAASATTTRAGDPPAVSFVRDGRGGGIAQLPPDTTSPPSTAPIVAPAPLPPVTRAAPVPTPAPARVEVAEIVVEPGDNLWELAARQVAASTGRGRADVDDAEIAPYWVLVCDTNRARLRSGDPNLVYPGERIALPPIS